jgi:hypothetical protein
VVQIVGTSSEASAQNVVKEVGGESRYFKKMLNGKPSVRRHLRQLPKPRRGHRRHQELASEDSGW